MASDDQHFLLYFITGTYFGPDMKVERPLKSIFQREAEGLLPYTSDQLARSQMNLVEVERVYYYVLRNVEKSLSVKLLLLHDFFDGTMITFGNPPPADYRQFPDFFPPQLHPFLELENEYKVIENIAFINDPDITYINPEELERFKRLTGLGDLELDPAAAIFDDSASHIIPMEMDQLVVELSHTSFEAAQAVEELSHTSTEAAQAVVELPRTSAEAPQPVVELSQSSAEATKAVVGLSAEAAQPVVGLSEDAIKLVRALATLKPPRPCKVTGQWKGLKQQKVHNVAPPSEQNFTHETVNVEKVGPPTIVMMTSSLKKEDWERLKGLGKNVLTLSGSVTTGNLGPAFGSLDVAECDYSYMFRIALPGARSDEDFSCVVETDGTVHVKGTTVTGEDFVESHGLKFAMMSKNLCPPGVFTLTFNLPGPVAPQEFKGSFKNGILEGIVSKAKKDNIVVDNDVPAAEA